MTHLKASYALKELIADFIAENNDYQKRCLYLQEILAMGRLNDVWRKALVAFFDVPFQSAPLRSFSKN